MNCSTPGLPVHHQLPEFTQTHVHCVSDAIQPSHPLWSPSPPALIFPNIRVFSNESVLHIRWPKNWSFSFNISPSNEHPGLVSFRMDWLDGVLIVIHQECCSFLTLPLLRAETSGLKSIPVDDSGGGLGGGGQGRKASLTPGASRSSGCPIYSQTLWTPRIHPGLHSFMCIHAQSLSQV